MASDINTLLDKAEMYARRADSRLNDGNAVGGWQRTDAEAYSRISLAFSSLALARITWQKDR